MVSRNKFRHRELSLLKLGSPVNRYGRFKKITGLTTLLLPHEDRKSLISGPYTNRRTLRVLSKGAERSFTRLDFVVWELTGLNVNFFLPVRHLLPELLSLVTISLVNLPMKEFPSFFVLHSPKVNDNVWII